MNNNNTFGKSTINVNDLNALITLLTNMVSSNGENFVCILGDPVFYDALLTNSFVYLNRGAKLKYLQYDIKILYTPPKNLNPNVKSKGSILYWIQNSNDIKSYGVLVIVIARENPFIEYGINDPLDKIAFRENMVVLDCGNISIQYPIQNTNNNTNNNPNHNTNNNVNYNVNYNINHNINNNPNNNPNHNSNHNFDNNFNQDQQGITQFQQVLPQTNNNLFSNRTEGRMQTEERMETEELGPLPPMDDVVINTNRRTMNNTNNNSNSNIITFNFRNNYEMEETFISGTNLYI